MKLLVICILITFKANAALQEVSVNKIADAIYTIEGGNKTKYPYGVKSVKTHGNKNKARNICIRTIQNTHNRWLQENKPINFLDYLANRYCPVQSDSSGNHFWRTNIRKFVKEIN